MTHLAYIDTPAALIDLRQMQANIERKFFDWWFDKTTNVPGIFGDAQFKAVSQAWQIGKDMGMIANVPDLRALVWDKTLRA